MRDWHINWRSSEIYPTRAVLRVHDVPWWAYCVEQLAEWIDTYLCHHRWCAPRDWTFRLGWGADEDGFRPHSLGSWLIDSFQWIMATADRHSSNELSVDLTEDWLVQNGQTDPLGDDDV